MKIDLQAQRKTCIKSDQHPKTKTKGTANLRSKSVRLLQLAVEPLLAVKPLHLAVEPVSGGWTDFRRLNQPSPELKKTARDQNTNRSNFWFTRSNFIKLDTHLLKDVWDLLQATIVKIFAKVLTFLRLSEGGFKNRTNTKTWSKRLLVGDDDQDDLRWVPTCQSKLDQVRKSNQNSRIKERPKIT